VAGTFGRKRQNATAAWQNEKRYGTTSRVETLIVSESQIPFIHGF
jgi:hypothetical protein